MNLAIAPRSTGPAPDESALGSSFGRRVFGVLQEDDHRIVGSSLTVEDMRASAMARPGPPKWTRYGGDATGDAAGSPSAEELSVMQGPTEPADDADACLSVLGPAGVAETVARLLEELAGLPDAPLADLLELRTRLLSQTFNLIVVGQFKRGKSSLINALLQNDLLPVGVVPLTSVVTVLAYGSDFAAEVRYQDGHSARIARDQLWEYTTEKGNPENAKGVQEVLVTYPSPWLAGGVRMVDTPGIGSIYQHNTDVALTALPKADALVLVLSADQPVSLAEREFLTQAAEYANRVFVLLNKADLLRDAELAECLTFAQDATTAALGRPVPVFPVSARRALEQHTEASGSDGGLGAFTKALRGFFAENKQLVLAESVARHALRLAGQIAFTIEVERKACGEPLDRLKEKLRAFSARREQLRLTGDEYAVLIEREAAKLLHDTVEADLHVFAEELTRQVLQSVDREYEDRRRLAPRVLLGKLEQRVKDEIRVALDRWRAQENEVVANRFAAACARLQGRTQDALDDLFRYSSELFDIPFEAVRSAARWQSDSRFAYKFWSEPPGLQLLCSALVLALPKFLADPYVLRTAREGAADLVRTQTGRIRHEFAQRLEASAHAFLSSSAQSVDAVLAGLDKALRSGLEMECASEPQVRAREQQLAARLQQVERVLTCLKESIAHNAAANTDR